MGAGGDTNVNTKAAEESSASLRKVLKDAERVFITAGIGGGSGIGTAAYVASLAKEMGAVVVALVTTPFNFEGSHGIDRAVAGIAGLRPYLDNLIVIHNG